MTLPTGVRLGPYEVLSPLGAGGMGEVYRATDTVLNRAVALKVLPDAFAADPERVARFKREAQVLASLNHPHIAQIYGFETSGPVSALAMELVEGPTLADRIPRGAVPIEEALRIARQIADALEAANEQGIIHRDLKPANIKVRRDGTVKVLDFGLAKAIEPTGVRSASASMSPTITTPAMSQAGMILGTAAYMSPEQARGLDVDKRTDVWAFGCVLFEMLTGRQAFAGPTATDIFAAILEREPDWTALPKALPPAVTRLLRRCLEKDARRRLRDIGDARADLDDLSAGSSSSAVLAVAPRSDWRWTGAAIALVALAGLAGWSLARRGAPERPAGTVHLSLSFLERPVSGPFGTRHLAISDDGSRVAYATPNRLWIRRLDQSEPTALDIRGSSPFFSPDGEWVGVFEDAGLVKMPIAGGNTSLLVKTTDRAGGAAWGRDGTIVFATTEGLYQVPDRGGEPLLLARPDRGKKERLYAWPQFLPDGKSVLYTIMFEPSASAPQITRLDLKTRQSTMVLTGGTSARYVAGGYMVYASGQILRSVRLDPATGLSQGDPVPLTGINVAAAAANDNGVANFAISETGTLVFTPAGAAGGVVVPGDLSHGDNVLEWIDRHGNAEPVAIQRGLFSYPRLSPDGARVALDVITNGNRDIWILELKRLSLAQLTNGPTEDLLPEWSADGRRIFFSSDRTGNFDIYSQAADGASEAKLEFAGPGAQMMGAVSPEGTRVVVYDLFKDLSLLTLGRPDRLEPLLHSDADERGSKVSPDGRWMVYESNESGGQFEIFLRPFPNVNDRREKISVNGGRFARWSPQGNEIYYVNLDGAMMAVPVTLSPTVVLGSAVKLFGYQKPPVGRAGLPYDVSRVDGRFLVTRPAVDTPGGSTTLSVVLNWLPELTRRMADVQRSAP